VSTRVATLARARHPSGMVWAFLDRWGGLLVLQGIAKGDPNETMNAIDDAFGEARASILDVHFFSGVHVSFSFEVHGSDVSTLGEALGRAGVALDETSLGALGEAKELDRAITGTLAVTFAHGDPNVRHEIPKVPG
jgi:hypothetical protein